MALRSKTRIYLDHASATPVRNEALQAMMDAEAYSGNPGAIHAEGVAALRILTESRERIAAALACRPREIVFTSGLTESNNLAILGLAQSLDRAGKSLEGTHWIVSSIEHDSILECFAEIERLGGKVTHIDPDERGVIAVEKVARALRPETVLVSVGWGNSEIGTLQPLSGIARVIRSHDKSDLSSGREILFHSDAGQAPLYKATNVHSLGVDLFSLGSGKLYGPRGIGALYIGKRATLSSLMFGGGQERGLRPGTESVALVAGFAEALALAQKEREAEGKRLQKMRDDFAREIAAHIPGVLINGSTSLTAGGNDKHFLPHMLNVSIPDINSEYLVLALDRAGIALSTKAACSEGNRNYSHVVRALGGPEWRAENTLRFSLGLSATESEMRRALGIFFTVYQHLPPSSP